MMMDPWDINDNSQQFLFFFNNFWMGLRRGEEKREQEEREQTPLGND